MIYYEVMGFLKTAKTSANSPMIGENRNRSVKYSVMDRTASELLEYVQSWLNGQGLSYFVSQHGEVGLLLNTRIVMFDVLQNNDKRQDHLRVSGRWNRTGQADNVSMIRNVVNNWNKETISPKASTKMNDKGLLNVEAECVVLRPGNMSDAQLNLFLSKSLVNISSFFEYLDTQLPDSI